MAKRLNNKLQIKHFKSLAVILSATVLIVIGSTLAYFSSKDETTNKFIGSRFDIVLTESNWNPENAENVIPGNEIPKNPQVKNNERTSGFIYLRVTVPCDTQMIDNNDGTPKTDTVIDDGIPLYKFMVKQGENFVSDSTLTPRQEVNTHWRLVSDNGQYTSYDEDNKRYTYVYAFADTDGLIALKRNEITEPLFDKLQLWNFNETGLDHTKSHNVLVEAFGIQTDLSGYSQTDISSIWYDLIDTGGGS